MIKKISRRLRVQCKKHAHSEVPKIQRSRVHVQKNLKTQSPVISKIFPPDHNKLLSKIQRVRPWQVFIADVSNVEIKILKGKKFPFIYFDKVNSVAIQKVLRKGKKKGLEAKTVQFGSDLEVPMVPGSYDVKGLYLKLDGKQGALVIAGTAQTQWQRLVA